MDQGAFGFGEHLDRGAFNFGEHLVREHLDQGAFGPGSIWTREHLDWRAFGFGEHLDGEHLTGSIWMGSIWWGAFGSGPYYIYQIFDDLWVETQFRMNFAHLPVLKNSDMTSIISVPINRWRSI